jgi:group I intron endonuclease
MRKISGIYQITNKINGCIYIGSSCNMRDRIAEHKRRLKSGTHVNKHLQNAYNKYSKDNFIFKTLLYCDVKNLYYYEQLCIDKLHPRYNIAICVEAPTRGLVVSEERRRKLSEIHKGKPLSEETKRKLSEAMKGRAPWSKGKTNVFSDETRRKMSEIQRNISDETRRKMSASLLGNKNCLGKRNALGHTPWNKGKTGIYSEDHRHKISEANRNRSAETRKKIGDSNRRRVVT